MNSPGLSKTIKLGPNSIENKAEEAVGIPTSRYKRLILNSRLSMHERPRRYCVEVARAW